MLLVNRQLQQAFAAYEGSCSSVLLIKAVAEPPSRRCSCSSLIAATRISFVLTGSTKQVLHSKVGEDVIVMPEARGLADCVYNHAVRQ